MFENVKKDVRKNKHNADKSGKAQLHKLIFG